MPTAYNYLEITDGDLSAVIMAADGSPTNYTLPWNTWAPSIAVPRPGDLGLPYLPTSEEWQININGSTPAACLGYLQTLNKLFDRAWRWWRKRHHVNALNDPVLIKYQLKGSTQAAPMQDVVIINDDRAPVLLPTDFTQVGTIYYILGIKIKFTRKNGLWLGSTETATVGATAAPGPLTVNFTEDANVLDPLAITLTSAGSGGVKTTATSGIIVCANRPGNYDVIEGASSGTGASNVFSGTTSTIDTTNLATNGRVGRVTATTSNSSYTSGTLVGRNELEYLALYVVIKNGSTTVDCIVYGEIITTGARVIAAPEVTLRAVNPSVPQVLFVGLWKNSDLEFTQQVRLNIRSVSGSITVDIDYAVAIWMEHTTAILAVNSIDPSLGIVIDHAMLTDQSALVQRASGAVRLLDYSGSPYMAYDDIARNASVFVALVQSNFWVVANVAGTAAATWAASVTRTKGYLTPE